MAIRQVRIDGDPILRKKSKDITEVNDRIKILLEDMVDTMEDEDGIGLAAPQIGVLRRAIVVDIGEGPIKMLNPEIVDEEGEKIDIEGCLSVPGRSGTVKRPLKIRTKYMDMEGKEQIMESEDLLARAICHEIDHLNGILYIDKMIEEVVLEDIDEDEEDGKK